MKAVLLLVTLAAALFPVGSFAEPSMKMTETSGQETTPTYLPGGDATNVLTVVTNAPATASVLVMTVGLATKKSGPPETVKAFGEVYSFQPATFAVHREEPTVITFWNLQPDDAHDLMLMDPDYDVLMKLFLPPLRKTSYVFTFHKEGLFPFYCTMHLPEMAGQILVLPPTRRPSTAGTSR